MGLVRMPADSAGGGTCGGIARGVMGDGERTGIGAGKELMCQASIGSQNIWDSLTK